MTDPTRHDGAAVSRRRVTAGGAWAVPVVALATAAPAHAATGSCPDCGANLTKGGGNVFRLDGTPGTGSNFALSEIFAQIQLIPGNCPNYTPVAVSVTGVTLTWSDSSTTNLFPGGSVNVSTGHGAQWGNVSGGASGTVSTAATVTKACFNLSADFGGTHCVYSFCYTVTSHWDNGLQLNGTLS